MRSTTNRGLAVVAMVVFVAGLAVSVNFALHWTGHSLHLGIPEPVSLALAGLGLVGLSQNLMRRFGRA